MLHYQRLQIIYTNVSLTRIWRFNNTAMPHEWFLCCCLQEQKYQKVFFCFWFPQYSLFDCQPGRWMSLMPSHCRHIALRCSPLLPAGEVASNWANWHLWGARSLFRGGGVGVTRRDQGLVGIKWEPVGMHPNCAPSKNPRGFFDKIYKIVMWE